MPNPGSPVNLALIKNTLLALGASVTFSTPINGFSTWAVPPSRRLKLWNQVDNSIQPAAFLVQHRERYEKSGVGLTKRYLEMGFYCYAPAGDPTSGLIGDDMLDIMISGFEAAFQAASDATRNEVTLNGLVYWCRINKGGGLFIRDPGDLDNQAMLVLPVEILLP